MAKGGHPLSYRLQFKYVLLLIYLRSNHLLPKGQIRAWKEVEILGNNLDSYRTGCCLTSGNHKSIALKLSCVGARPQGGSGGDMSHKFSAGSNYSSSECEEKRLRREGRWKMSSKIVNRIELCKLVDL